MDLLSLAIFMCQVIHQDPRSLDKRVRARQEESFTKLGVEKTKIPLELGLVVGW